MVEMWSGYSSIASQSLRAYRVALGLLAAFSVLRRWEYASVLYRETGIYPLDSIRGTHGAIAALWGFFEQHLSIHILFLSALLVALLFAFGRGMRVVRWLLFPAMLVLHVRAHDALTGGEVVLHFQTLYAAFFPWSALERDLKNEPRAGGEREPHVRTIRTAIYPVILFQLSFIYLFSALTKRGESWLDGSAVYRSLAAPSFATPLGAWIAERSPLGLLEGASYATIAVEGILPLLLLTPWKRASAHRVAGLLMIGFHGAIALSMEVGIFSAAMLIHLPLLYHPGADKPRALIPRERRSLWAEHFVAAAFIYLSLASAGRDMSLVPSLPKLPLPAPVSSVSYQLMLHQNWRMFAPDPPSDSRLVVTLAETRGGRVFDPWRSIATGSARPLEALPGSAVETHLLSGVDVSLLISGRGGAASENFARFLLRQALTLEDGSLDPVERFDSFHLLIRAADRRALIPDEELDGRLGVQALPWEGPLPVELVSARGVWAAERAFDGRIVPEGAHGHAPVSAVMGAGCPWLILDLRSEREIKSVYLQAANTDHFILEASRDGERFQVIGEAERLIEGGRGMRSRLINVDAPPLRYLKVRPGYSRHARHHLAEIALYDREITLDALELGRAEDERFFYSRLRPAVVSAISGARAPDPSCPAEDYGAIE